MKRIFIDTNIVLDFLLEREPFVEDAISQILTDLHICTVDKNILETAVALNFRDFEDAVQYACAMKSMVDVIVTRDVCGFLGSEIPVILPGELNHISQE
ncbi:MAG: PIN domain-containing protein [Sphaerospermopsis sp. SIO1G1]|nr:PIN domain-containing protein [Sphaerospermopsis sp. SIO1G1]